MSLEDRITGKEDTMEDALVDTAVPSDSANAQNPPQVDGSGQGQGGGALADSEYDVVVKPIDPNSPLYSVKSFEELGLPETLLKGIYSMHFSRPSKIQEAALPLILNDPPVNLIAQSQSGTGKTAAFALNILKRLDLTTEELRKQPQAIVLSPTRELARQIQGVIQNMGTYMEGLKVATAIPVDISQRGQKIEASVVVGTPGTAFDMVKKRLMDPRAVKVLVLDEADNMLEASMGEQSTRIKSALPKSAQILLFSATWPVQVVKFAKQFAPNANEMTLPHNEQTVEGIKQLYMDCASDQDKYDVLVKLYGLMTIGQSVIFVKTKATAAQIEQRMIAEGHQVASLTSEYQGAQRDAIIDAFRKGIAKVLIATNVLSRGIDVQSVSMVVNYDVPDLPNGKADPETYLHRIGRTGRFGRVGVAVTFVHDRKSWDQLNQIAQHFNTNIERVETTDWDEVEEIIQRIVKNPAAQAGYQPERVGESTQMAAATAHIEKGGQW